MVDLTMNEIENYTHNDFFEYLPRWSQKFLNVFTVISGVGILSGLVLSIAALNVDFYNIMISGSYAVGLFSMGLLLSVLAFSIIQINLQRHKEGLKTFAVSKFGKDEGHGYYMNQLINMGYILFGVGLMIVGVVLFHNFCC